MSYYPVVKCPHFSKFQLAIESVHRADNGCSENVGHSIGSYISIDMFRRSSEKGVWIMYMVTATLSAPFSQHHMLNKHSSSHCLVSSSCNLVCTLLPASHVEQAQ
nr:hypothetical protein CFP56_21455 [Quercus suber]